MTTATATRSIADVALPEDEPPASTVDISVEPSNRMMDPSAFTSLDIEHLTAVTHYDGEVQVVLLGNHTITITADHASMTPFQGRTGYVEYSLYGDKKHIGSVVTYNADLKTIAVFWSASSTIPLATFRVV